MTRPVAGNNRKQTAMKGTIKFFSEDRGFGFIARDDGDDVFVHRTNVVGGPNVTLEPGQTVEFDIGPGRKGDEALNVRVV